MLQVVNKKGLNKDNNSIDIYIGRPSILGNPFRIGSDGSREEVIEKYRQWLWARIEEKGFVYKELRRIANLVRSGKHIRLVCWCAPLSCHGEVIKRAIEWLCANT